MVREVQRRSAGLADDQLTGIHSTIAEIAGLMLSDESMGSILELVVDLTGRTVREADGVGVTMIVDGSYTSPVVSDEWVLRIDSMQYEAGEGPCLSAAEEMRTYRIDDLPQEGRWPHFSEAAAEAGVRSVLAIPLMPTGDVIGALNVYSFTPHAFDDERSELAAVVAKQAAIVLANSHAFSTAERLNDQLVEALESRDVIGQAKGILMERERVGAEEAFEILRAASQKSNRKLREIAQETVDAAERRLKS